MHRSTRGSVPAALLLVALAIQVTLLSWLPLPGATPDLVLLVLVAVALRGGPGLGIVAGFGAGLALDLVPPADHAIGRWAIVLCLIGYCCGLLEDEADRSAIFPLFVAAAASAASVLGFVALGVLIDDPRASIQAVLRVLPTVVAYDVLLSPFVFSVIFRLHRRMEIGHVIHSGGRVR